MKFKEGDILRNRYIVEKEIGRGGTATVYLAYDNRNKMNVALKVSNENAKVSSLKERFHLEAKVLKRINSTNVVKFYDLFTERSSIIIVIEYIDGKGLKEILERKEILTRKQAIRIILEILKGLEPLRLAGYIHRDIKPNNIMVGYDNIVKIMDFGIVQESENQALTRQGNIIGSIQYMAPELIDKSKKAHEGSEIYSLGIMLYKMLTGMLPYYGSNLEDTAIKIIEGNAVPANRISKSMDKELNDIIMKMIDKEYLKRYLSFSKLSYDLEKYLDKNIYNKGNSPDSEEVKKKDSDENSAAKTPQTIDSKIELQRKKLKILLGLFVFLTIGTIIALIVLIVLR